MIEEGGHSRFADLALANVGVFGEAGMAAFLNHDAVEELPVVLETPTEDGRSFEWNTGRARELYER